MKLYQLHDLLVSMTRNGMDNKGAIEVVDGDGRPLESIKISRDGKAVLTFDNSRANAVDIKEIQPMSVSDQILAQTLANNRHRLMKEHISMRIPSFTDQQKLELAELLIELVIKK